jgi:hypothetical protein
MDKRLDGPRAPLSAAAKVECAQLPGNRNLIVHSSDGYHTDSYSNSLVSVFIVCYAFNFLTYIGPTETIFRILVLIIYAPLQCDAAGMRSSG